LSEEKDWENEIEEIEKVEKRANRHEQTLANLIILAFIGMVVYKLMTGTF